MLSRVGFPLASKYILRVAADGALSRKSTKVVRPSAIRISMNPPPPIFPAKGYVTARAIDCNRGIHRVASGLEHRDPNIGCMRLLRDNHSVPCEDRLARIQSGTHNAGGQKRSYFH